MKHHGKSMISDIMLLLYRITQQYTEGYCTMLSQPTLCDASQNCIKLHYSVHCYALLCTALHSTPLHYTPLTLFHVLPLARLLAGLPRGLLCYIPGTAAWPAGNLLDWRLRGLSIGATVLPCVLLQVKSAAVSKTVSLIFCSLALSFHC